MSEQLTCLVCKKVLVGQQRKYCSNYCADRGYTQKSKKEHELIQIPFAVAWPEHVSEDGQIEPIDFADETNLEDDLDEKLFYEMCLKIWKERSKGHVGKKNNFTDDQIIDMLNMRLEGYQYTEIADKYETSHQLINQNTLKLANDLQHIAERLISRSIKVTSTDNIVTVFDDKFKKSFDKIGVGIK